MAGALHKCIRIVADDASASNFIARVERGHEAERLQETVMTMNATNRDALIQALTECRKQLDYFASFLEGYDEESMILLRSAAKILNLRSNVLHPPWVNKYCAPPTANESLFKGWNLPTHGVNHANARPI